MSVFDSEIGGKIRKGTGPEGLVPFSGYRISTLTDAVALGFLPLFPSGDSRISGAGGVATLAGGRDGTRSGSFSLLTGNEATQDARYSR